MSAQAIQRGQEVYSIEGAAGRYIAAVANGHIVEPIFDPQEPDESPYYADPVTWREVFSKPPVERLQKDIASLEQRRQSVTAELAQLREQRVQFDREERELAARLKRHEQLAHIEDILEGRITHVLVRRSYYSAVQLQTFADFVKFDSSNGTRKMVPLLVLAATSGTYREHSDHWWNKLIGMKWCSTEQGNFDDCWLFPSVEAAKTAARAMLEADLAAARKEAAPSKTVPIAKIASIVDNMKALGLDVPNDLLAAWTLHMQREAEWRLSVRRKESEKAQAELAAAEAAARAAGVHVESAVATGAPQ